MGYRVAFEMYSVASVGPLDKVGQQVWQCKIPQKVKDFLWRDLKRFVLTKLRLRDKGVPLDSAYARCSSEEDLEHVMLSCPKATEVWRATGLAPNSQSFGEFVIFLLSSMHSTSSRQGLVLLWNLWVQRNVLFGKRLIWLLL